MQNVLNDKAANGVMKYLYGYVLLALGAAVITLFGMYINLNNYVRDELTKELIRSNMVIETNTNYLKLQSIK